MMNDDHNVKAPKMGEVIRFSTKSEQERTRLIREARAIYDSIFPPSVSVTEQSEKTPIGHAADCANAYCNIGVFS